MGGGTEAIGSDLTADSGVDIAKISCTRRIRREGYCGDVAAASLKDKYWRGGRDLLARFVITQLQLHSLLTLFSTTTPKGELARAMFLVTYSSRKKMCYFVLSLNFYYFAPSELPPNMSDNLGYMPPIKKFSSAKAFAMAWKGSSS